MKGLCLTECGASSVTRGFVAWGLRYISVFCSNEGRTGGRARSSRRWRHRVSAFYGLTCLTSSECERTIGEYYCPSRNNVERLETGTRHGVASPSVVEQRANAVVEDGIRLWN